MDFLGGYARKGLFGDRVLKIVLALLAAVIVLGSVYYVFFRNWREELQARRFFKLLQMQRYEEAYTMWGCSIQQPCRYYPYEEFLEDWGPDSPFGIVADYSVGRSYTQPNGVILRYSINGMEGDPLWIESGMSQIGFAPN